MKRNLKITNNLIVTICIVFFLIFCSFLSSIMAQEPEETVVQIKEKDIVALRDPFSTPQTIQDLLAAKEKKVQEIVGQNNKKIAQAGYALDKKRAGLKKDAVLVKTPELPLLIVSGIIFSDTKSQTIINGNVLAVGDTINFPTGLASISSIEKDQVTIAFMGQSHILRISDQNLKLPSKGKK
jgi:hypothetical protein